MKIESGFFCRYQVLSLVAFLTATVLPATIDRLLVHHVRFGAREYPQAKWLIPALSAFLFLGNIVVSKLSVSPYLLLSPFFLSFLGTFFIFRQEIPHGTVANITAIWMVAALSGIWVHTSSLELHATMDSRSFNPILLADYLKTELGWWNSTTWGSMAAMIALSVAWQKNIVDASKYIVGEENHSEQFLLNVSGGFQIAVLLLLIFAFPIREIAQTRKFVASELLKIAIVKRAD